MTFQLGNQCTVQETFRERLSSNSIIDHLCIRSCLVTIELNWMMTTTVSLLLVSLLQI